MGCGHGQVPVYDRDCFMDPDHGPYEFSEDGMLFLSRLFDQFQEPVSGNNYRSPVSQVSPVSSLSLALAPFPPSFFLTFYLIPLALFIPGH